MPRKTWRSRLAKSLRSENATLSLSGKPPQEELDDPWCPDDDDDDDDENSSKSILFLRTFQGLSFDVATLK